MWLTRSVIAAFYPRVGEVPGVDELGLDEYLAAFQRDAPPLMRIGLLLGAVVFALTPILTIGWPLPSFLLPKEALDRHAYRVATHPSYLLRQITMVPKMIGGMCWGQHPRVRSLHGLAAYSADPGTWRS